jgi:hypothetical protein
MKTFICLVFLSLISAAAPSSSPQCAERICGEYLEARTASVFAGPCHYNGEVVTTGRDAVMAWRFNSGQWHGVDLGGLRVMAAVSSDKNLGQELPPAGTRKAEVMIDAGASDAQASALTDLIRAKYGESLGQVVAIRRAPIHFEHKDGRYVIHADGFAQMCVQPMPNSECCKQPHLVWYSPLIPLNQRKVGYTQTAAYVAGNVGDAWKRAGENSAFYGAFSF